MSPFARFTATLLLAGCCLLAAPVPLRGGDWHCWRGPQGNGISDETDWTHAWPPGGPPVLWRAAVGSGFSATSIGGGRLVTLGNDDGVETVYCLDAASGGEIWRHSYDCPLDDRFFEGGPTATPTIDADAVYTLSRQGHLFCFDAASGNVRWSQNIQQATGARIPGWGFGGSPRVHGDLLLLNVGDAGTAVDKTTGRLVWQSGDGEAGYTTPLLVQRDERWFALIASSKFYHAVDAETGQPQWRLRWLTRFGANAADPVVVGDRVFISSGYNRGAALLEWAAGEPEVVWSGKQLQNQFSSSVLVDGHLFGVDGDTTGTRLLKCVELTSGKVVWETGGLGSASLIAAGGRLVILAEHGELIVARASPEGFAPLARAAVLNDKCWTAPALAHGRIYCRGAGGEVVCVDVRANAGGR